MHLVLFHPPAVFLATDTQLVAVHIYILFAVLVFIIDCLCCIFEKNKLSMNLNLRARFNTKTKHAPLGRATRSEIKERSMYVEKAIG